MAPPSLGLHGEAQGTQQIANLPNKARFATQTFAMILTGEASQCQGFLFQEVSKQLEVLFNRLATAGGPLSP
jgi:hypothetical protein